MGACLDVLATDEHIYYLVEEDGILKWLRQTTEAENAPGEVEWSATFGAYGYEYSLKKYLTRFDLRLQLRPGTRVKVEIQYDHESKWYNIGTITGRNVASFLLPIVPRRCDHCQVRLTGKGAMKLLGIARIL